MFTSLAFYFFDIPSIYPQSEGVMIYKLDREMSRLIRWDTLFQQSIVDIPLKEVDYGWENQLADEALFMGAETTEFIRKEDFPPAIKKRIYQSVH